MAQNPNVSQLDASQIAQREFDNVNDAKRVSIGSAEFVVSGQGVYATGAVAHSSTGAAIALTPCAGTKEFQIYAVATTATTGSLVLRIDVTPDVAGVYLYQTSTTLTLPASSLNAIVVSSVLNNLIANNVQVTIVSNALGIGETAQVYIVGNTF